MFLATSNYQSNVIVSFFVFCVMMIASGCASSLGGLRSTEVVDPNMYNGSWNMNIQEYKKTQMGPSANPAYARVRWDCGDGQPYSLPITIDQGQITLDIEGTPEPVAISETSAFRIDHDISDTRVLIYKGNLALAKGSIELRANGAKGCVKKFTLTRL